MLGHVNVKISEHFFHITDSFGLSYFTYVTALADCKERHILTTCARK